MIKGIKELFWSQPHNIVVFQVYAVFNSIVNLLGSLAYFNNLNFKFAFLQIIVGLIGIMLAYVSYFRNSLTSYCQWIFIILVIIFLAFDMVGSYLSGVQIYYIALIIIAYQTAITTKSKFWQIGIINCVSFASFYYEYFYDDFTIPWRYIVYRLGFSSEFDGLQISELLFNLNSLISIESVGNILGVQILVSLFVVVNHVIQINKKSDV